MFHVHTLDGESYLIKHVESHVVFDNSTKELESDKQIMADRIIGMRTTLRESLEKLGSPLSWEHVTKQVINY